MKKRIICFLLSAVLMLGLFCGAAPSVHAASEMKASEGCISLIKSMEGFTQYPYADGAQYSVGYGTRVEDEDLAKYQKYGITLAEADALLRVYVAEFEGYLNRFIDKYSLTLSQNQFDALLSFTYNVGNGWMNNDTNFRKAVLNGYTGNDFLYAITQWCMADSAVSTHLVKRRLIEANIYLNNNYSESVPSTLSYVVFECTEGSCAVRVQGYNAFLTDSVRPTPSRSGYYFLGWYDSDGKWITTLDSSTAGKTLTPHWQKGTGEVDENGNIVGVAAKYDRYVTTGDSLIVRKAPNSFAETIKTLSSNDKVTIVAEYMDSGLTKWGKLSTGGWINLSAGTSNDAVSGEAIDPLKVTVLQSGVNIRSGPGTKYTKLGTFTKGEELTLVAVAEGGIYLWGKSEKGWICLDYTNYEEAKLAQGPAEDEAAVLSGVITRCYAVNVRQAAGVSNKQVGKITAGTIVEIYETTTVGTQEWGRTTLGWICMDYVDPVEDVPADSEDTDSDTDESAGSTAVTGTVVNASQLNIRSGAGTHNAKVGTYSLGTRVTILETTVYNGATWGRTDKGWVHMNYIELDETTVPDSGTTEDTEPEQDDTTGTTDTVVKTGVITNTAQVNIRSAAGVENAKVGTYTRGTRVNIYETTTYRGAQWARTDKGWVHMFYIQLDATPVTGSGSTGSDTGSSDSSGSSGSTGTTVSGVQTGKIVNTAQVNIRYAASADSQKVGTYTKGTRIVILETATVNGATWCRTNKGWVHMFYVQVEQLASGSTIGTVTTTLNIRSAAGADNKKVGTYAKGDVVVILETTTVNGSTWGRTDKGWISMFYVNQV